MVQVRRAVGTSIEAAEATFAYNLNGQRTSVIDGNGNEYDAAGRRTRLVYPLGVGAFRFEHLDTGEMAAVRTDGGQVLATFGYDQLGRRSSLTRSNGTATSYGYDGVGRLTGLTHDLAGTASDNQATLAYNPAGQIVSRSSSNQAYSYTALASENRLDQVNGLNQVTNSGGTALAHDARGNTTQIGSVTYAYTADNQMAAVNGQNFYTDPLGRLVHSGAANRDFLYDIGSNQIILDRTGFGGPLNRAYVPGPGENEPLMALNPGTGAIEHLHQDERGSVIAISDGLGSATAVNRYDEYDVPQPVDPASAWRAVPQDSGRAGGGTANRDADPERDGASVSAFPCCKILKGGA